MNPTIIPSKEKWSNNGAHRNYCFTQKEKTFFFFHNNLAGEIVAHGIVAQFAHPNSLVLCSMGLCMLCLLYLLCGHARMSRHTLYFRLIDHRYNTNINTIHVIPPTEQKKHIT